MLFDKVETIEVIEEYQRDGDEYFCTTFIWNGETKVILRFEKVEKWQMPRRSLNDT